MCNGRLTRLPRHVYGSGLLALVLPTSAAATPSPGPFDYDTVDEGFGDRPDLAGADGAVEAGGVVHAARLDISKFLGKPEWAAKDAKGNPGGQSFASLASFAVKQFALKNLQSVTSVVVARVANAHISFAICHPIQ
jgi:hypothetical protein